MRSDGGLWVPGAMSPGTPSVGNILYPKADNQWYTKDSAGNEVLAGSKNVPTPALASDSANKSYVDTAVASMSPSGQRLGSAARTTTFSVSGGGAITGLTVTVTGTGRYVDIGFYAAQVWHSAANTAINVNILVNGSTTGGTYATTWSSNTTYGPFVSINFEKLLTNATSYTFTVFLATGPGTVSAFGDPNAPMQLTVTQR